MKVWEFTYGDSLSILEDGVVRGGRKMRQIITVQLGRKTQICKVSFSVCVCVSITKILHIVQYISRGNV